MSQINPRFWYKYFAQSAGTHITYLLSDITFKKTYCVPLFKLFRQKGPQLGCAIAFCF